MVKNGYYIFLWMLALQVFASRLQAQENYEIRRIDFVGNKTLEKSYLMDKMATDEVSYLDKVFSKDEPTLFNRDLMEIEMERLRKVYQGEGFVDVKIKLDPPKINDQKKTVHLLFVIEEGEPYTIDSVLFRFSGPGVSLNNDSLAKAKMKELKLLEGERFRDESLKEDLSVVRNIFLDLGYAYAQVDYELGLKTDRHSTSITYVVTPGPVCVLGETRLVGNKKISEKFIEKQVIYKEGDRYDKSVLDKTREDLYHLRLFRIVSVLPQKEYATLKNPIPVTLYVEEAPRVNTKFGVGYGTEDKFRTFADFTYLGFLGTARRINIYAKHSALEPYYFSFKWIQPKLFNKKGSVSINPFLGINSEPGYETRTYGINLPLTYEFDNSLNSTLTYYFEKVEQRIEEGDTEVPDPEDEEYLYNKSGIQYSSVYSTAKPKFSPEQGVNISLGVKLNGYVFGGDFSYVRLWSDFRTYQKIGDCVLALRLMEGGIYSSDASGFIPVEDRFYSGGSNSIRGWSRSELGPKRESGTPMGGKSILEANIELRYPLFRRVNGVAFFESGNVWEKAFHYRLNELAYAIGGGLRIETPIGPVRFDVGVPLWNEKRSAQFFLSVGQAF